MKQLNAARNCSPQGPCAIPPRQGHSQFISPVASLKAPSWEASSSVVSRSVSVVVIERVVLVGGVGDGVEGFWRKGASDSRVGRGVSSEGTLGGGMATRDGLVVERPVKKNGVLTRWLFSKQRACVVVVNRPNG